MPFATGTRFAARTFPRLRRAACLTIVLAGTACGGASEPQAAPTPTPSPLDASHWMGHQWNITNGGMAGVAQGSPANVFLDANGSLHLRIANSGGTWTAAELFSADNMGFGTYQWQVRGNVYAMDPSTVLGLFPYGPANGVGVDGENEIDTEFSQWNSTCGCNADFTVYPSTGNRFPGGDSSWTDNFTIAGSGSNLTTVRMEWSSTRIVFTIMDGLQALGTTANVLQTQTYTADTVHIPQVPIPVGMNLWCFQTTPASAQEVTILSFQFVPQATTASGRRAR